MKDKISSKTDYKLILSTLINQNMVVLVALYSSRMFYKKFMSGATTKYTKALITVPAYRSISISQTPTSKVYFEGFVAEHNRKNFFKDLWPLTKIACKF